MRTRRCRLPEIWKEIPYRQRVSAYKSILDHDKSEALRYALRLPRRTWKRLLPEDKAALLQKCTWAKLKPSADPVFDFFDHDGIRYYLPAPKFENAVCLEYPLADDYLLQFLDPENSNSQNALLGLCATLCREAHPDISEALRREDNRVPLHSRGEIEARMRRMRNLPVYFQTSVLLYFSGVKELVHRMYGQWLFEQPDEDEKAHVEDKKADPLGWWGMFLDAAKGDLTKLEAIHQSNFHTFCLMEVRRRKQIKDAEMRQRFASKDFGKVE